MRNFAQLGFILLFSPLAVFGDRVQLQGQGDSLSDSIQLNPGLLMIGAAHRGNENFVVRLLSSDGQSQHIVVNEIGDYKGTHLISVDGGSYRIRTQADGAWTLMYEQPDPNASGESLPASVSLEGAAPLGPISLRKGLLIAKLSHSGSDNFVVRLFTADGELAGILANEIGSYSGEIAEPIRKSGNYWLAIEADGAWSASLKMSE